MWWYEMDVKIKRTDKELPLPNYKHYGDAGMDICSAETHTLTPGEYYVFKTGIYMEIPEGYEVQVRPRSGLAAKKGISIVNTPGTVDHGYRGEFMVILINLGKESYEVKRGERIAQLVFNKFETVNLVEVDELNDSQRGSSGFGSTGKM